MKYDVRMSTRFKRDMKLVQKRGYDQRLIFKVIELLANGMKLDEKYKEIIDAEDSSEEYSILDGVFGFCRIPLVCHRRLPHSSK